MARPEVSVSGRSGALFVLTEQAFASMKQSRQAAHLHRIGDGARFVGDVRFSGRLEVDGVVVGSILSEAAGEGEVVVGAKGRVEGPIVAGSVVIAGQVEGSIQAAVRLEVLAGARVRGDVVYRDLQIQHGALVEGALRSVDDDSVGLKLVANCRT